MFRSTKSVVFVTLITLLALSAGPVLADTEAFFTGGGVIRDGHGLDAHKITFSVDVFVVGEGQPEGQIQFQFHVTGNPGLNKSKFEATEFSEFSVNTLETEELGNFTYIRLWAHGELNREDGWSVLARFTDFGMPAGKQNKSDARGDAVRIMLFDPNGEAVYDTAQDYPREQSWRALLDGGNVTLYFSFDHAVP